MELFFAKRAKEDMDYWQENNPKLSKRIYQLINAIKKSPYKGIGKPEPLRFGKTGYWSRRIDREHCLVYKVVGKQIYIAQCRYHYDD